MLKQIYPLQDTFVDQADDNPQDYSTVTMPLRLMVANEETRILLDFNLSVALGSAWGNSKRIRAARLYLTAITSGDCGENFLAMGVDEAGAVWDEATVKWSTAPTNPYAVYATFNDTAPQNKFRDVLTLLRDRIVRDKRLKGFVLVWESSTPVPATKWITIASVENANSSYRPRLDVTLSPPGENPTISDGMSGRMPQMNRCM